MGRLLRPVINQLEVLVTQKQAVLAQLAAEHRRLRVRSRAAAVAVLHGAALQHLSELLHGRAHPNHLQQHMGRSMSSSSSTATTAQAAASAASAAAATEARCLEPGGPPGGDPPPADDQQQPMDEDVRDVAAAAAAGTAAEAGTSLNWDPVLAAEAFASNPPPDLSTAGFAARIERFCNTAAPLLM